MTVIGLSYNGTDLSLRNKAYSCFLVPKVKSFDISYQPKEQTDCLHVSLLVSKLVMNSDILQNISGDASQCNFMRGTGPHDGGGCHGMSSCFKERFGGEAAAMPVALRTAVL